MCPSGQVASCRISRAVIERIGPSEHVWLRLPPPGAVVTWLVTGSPARADLSLWYGNPRSDEPYPDLGANRRPSPIRGSVACGLGWFTRVALEELRRFPGMREGSVPW